MNRRGFLSTLGAILAGATLDPEELLWRPGKLISIPAPRPQISEGLWIRTINWYNPVEDRLVTRVDILHGWFDPERPADLSRAEEVHMRFVPNEQLQSAIP